MLRFFKSSLPAQIIALLLLVLALRLPLLWLGLPLTAEELRALLVGERLHGGAMPYRDLYDGTAPLAAAFFAGLDAVLARPVWLYRLGALSLLLIQALRLNLVFARYDVHPDRGYVTALTYLLVGSISTDLDTLSPLLLGHTFIVFSLSALLPTSREGYDNRRLFRAGFFIGLGALCYLPLGLFVLVGLFAVVIFAASSFRSSLLLLCGFLFPYALVATFLFYEDALPDFWRMHLQTGLNDLISSELPAGLQLRLLIVPMLVLVAGLVRALSSPLGLVFQVKFRQLMLVWLAVAGAAAAVEHGAAPGVLVLLLAPMAYFSLFLWQRDRQHWWLELLLLLLLNVTGVLRYRAYIPRLENLLHMPAESRFGVEPDPRFAALRGQTMLVLGPDDRPYYYTRPATPYLDWTLSQADFGHLNEYAAVVRVAQKMGPVPPTYLFDQRHLVPHLQRLLPGIFSSYQPTGTPGLYRRK